MGVLKCSKRSRSGKPDTSIPKKFSTIENEAGAKIIDFMKQIKSTFFAKKRIFFKKVESNIPEIVAEEWFESL